MQTAPVYTNTVRIGYARVSGRTQDHQMQLDALAVASCREVIVETASTRGARPKLHATLAALKPGDTLVIYKPDRIARSMKELLVLLEDELHARQVNLEILTGICAGFHRPSGQTIADKMLFMVAAMAAEMERDLIQERTLDGLAAAAAQGRRGGRPAAVDADTLAVARARQARGESITAIAAHLGIGRSTLYRALTPDTTADGAESTGHSTEGDRNPLLRLLRATLHLIARTRVRGPDVRESCGSVPRQVRQRRAQFHRRDRESALGQRNRRLPGPAANLDHPVSAAKPGQPDQIVEQHTRAGRPGPVIRLGISIEPAPELAPRAVFRHRRIHRLIHELRNSPASISSANGITHLPVIARRWQPYPVQPLRRPYC